jgi:hypothetical protein
VLILTHARELLIAAGAILAGWLLLSGAVYAAAACVAVGTIRFRRCLLVPLPIIVGGVFWLVPVRFEVPTAAPILIPATLAAATIFLGRFLLRTTWLRALATFAITCLYAFAVGAAVYRVVSGMS